MPPSQPPDADAPGAERRRDVRAPIELKVEYKRLNSFFADYTRNLSKGGTFIATNKPLPIGTEFVFRLTVPNLEQPLEIHGKVAWTVAPENATREAPAGMGIRFQYRDDEARAAIHGVIEKLIYESLGRFVGARLLEHSRAEPGSTGGNGGTDTR
jgi:type IV pilus assembly protein PilZ